MRLAIALGYLGLLLIGKPPLVSGGGFFIDRHVIVM